jgi:hypothetical protein
MAKAKLKPSRKKSGGDFDEILDLVISHNLKRDSAETLDGKTIPAYQFIYGSELYGTLFGVFARFETTEIDEDTCSVNSVMFKLFNYRGIVNIGFTDDAPLYQKKKLSIRVKNKTYSVPQTSINFCVQGLSLKRELLMSFSRNKPVIVSKNNPLRVVFRREVCPLPGFDDGSTPSSINPNSLIPIPSMPDSLFDSEFCYRSGEDCYKQPIHPGMKGNKFIPLPSFPGARCFESQVILYYY